MPLNVSMIPEAV